jgi:hypothetical protein
MILLKKLLWNQGFRGELYLVYRFPHHALVRLYVGISNDDPDVVKGRAGIP